MESRNATAAEPAVAENHAMNLGGLDLLVMLLSTDWFLPYWFMLGIQMEREKTFSFQEGCREIVKQIMGGAKEYWHVGLSEERTDRTRSMFQALLQKCQIDSSTIERINALTRDEEILDADQKTGWLAVVITMQLLQNSLGKSPTLDKRIKKAVGKVWDSLNRAKPPKIDFKELCLSSKSDWDAFIRNATPDQPAMLAHDVSAIVTKNEFDLFWAAINANLSTIDSQELRNWYRQVGELLTGEPLQLP